MGLVVLVPDLVAGKVGVDLGRRDVGVAEHLLDVPEGCSTLSMWVAKLWRRTWGVMGVFIWASFA